MRSSLIDALNTLVAVEVAGKSLFTVDNTLVVCGAGISMESNFPSGMNLINAVLNTFDLGKQSSFDLCRFFQDYNKSVTPHIEGYIPDLYDAPRLEILFKCIKDVLPPDDYANYVKSVLFFDYRQQRYHDYYSPNYNHRVIADFISSGGIVLTSNFDPMIELELEAMGCHSFNKIVFPITHNKPINPNVGTIVKYHGDIEQIDTIGIDVGNLYIGGFGPNEEAILDTLFANKLHIVFVGSSLSDSLDFIPYFRKWDKASVTFLNYSNEWKVQAVHRKSSLGKRVGSAERILHERVQKNGVQSWIVSNKYNRIQREAEASLCLGRFPEYPLSKDDIAAFERVRNTLIQNNSIRKTVSYNILMTYGLLKLAHLTEASYMGITSIWEDKFKSFLRNIDGDYLYVLKRVGKKDLLRHFQALQEYVFLQKGQWLHRLLLLPRTAIEIAQIKKKFNKGLTPKEQLDTITCMSLYSLRRIQIMQRLGLTRLVPASWVSSFYKFNGIHFSLSKELKDLQSYRFARRERLYVDTFLERKPKEQLKSELIELLEVALDTNYFIEVNNLLRFGATYTNDNGILEAFKLSTDKTGDSLNLNKMRK